MRLVKSFLLGTVALGILGYALVAALAVAAQAGSRTLDIALGPLTLVAITADGTSTATTFGPGLVVVALVGGIANLAAAFLLSHRHRRTRDRVE